MEIAVTEDGAGVEVERRQLAAAIATAQGQLAALRAQLHAKADPAKAAIFAAHEELLSDPDLLEIVESAIAKGQERGIRMEEGGHDPRRPAGRAAQSTARATRERPARCRPARAVDPYRSGNQAAGVSGQSPSSLPKISLPRTRRRSTARA